MHYDPSVHRTTNTHMVGKDGDKYMISKLKEGVHMNHVLSKASRHNLKFRLTAAVLISVKSTQSKNLEVYSVARNGSSYKLMRHIASNEVKQDNGVSLIQKKRENVDMAAFEAFDIGVFILKLLDSEHKIDKPRAK